MGEYATFNRVQIKIGTCESMYYLRADQAHKVVAEAGSVDPVRDAGSIRFRFPFPDEDGVKPGEFEKFDRGVGVSGVVVPSEVDHDSVQFSARPGYLVSLPCPESVEGKAMGLLFHKNGWNGDVLIQQQRLWEGRMVLVCSCGGCGSKYRLETLVEASPVVEKCIEHAERENNRPGGTEQAKWWTEVARRIVAGYNEPKTIAPWL